MADPMIGWKPLLAWWSEELMRTGLAERVSPPTESPDWLGFEPATDSDIATLEARLGLILPPSYRSFLMTTNGWRITTRFIYRIRPAAEVNWFRVENENWVQVYEQCVPKLSADYDYRNLCRYTEDGTEVDYHPGHMKSLLQISDVGDGVYLLNPEAVTHDGEWEAWFFANWMAGPRRFPSFAHLLLREFATFRELEKITGPELPKLPIPERNVPRISARSQHRSE
jgi:hypothetical protein